MAERAGKLLQPLRRPGAQLGSVARRQARRPDRAGCPWPYWRSQPLGDLDCGRRPAREAGQARGTPAGGAGPGPRAAPASRASGLRGDRTLAAPPASPHRPCPPDRDLVKGLALFSFAPLLLQRPPFTPQLIQALPLQRSRRSEPGALEVLVVGGKSPSPPCTPLCAVDAPPIRSPQGLGPGLALPFSSPRQRQAL